MAQKLHRVSAFKCDEVHDVGMENNDANGICPCCGATLPGEQAPESCMLNKDCCPACVARCMAVDRCGLIDDQEFWNKLDAFFSGFGKQRIIPGTYD